mmetsp:Transcript_20825/g.52966  ORF Transcript_20825/g.52966 Transcript_20825/m.52966 type:complete len:109 (-) Transcript_20825:1355-1681(-)
MACRPPGADTALAQMPGDIQTNNARGSESVDHRCTTRGHTNHGLGSGNQNQNMCRQGLQECGKKKGSQMNALLRHEMQGVCAPPAACSALVAAPGGGCVAEWDWVLGP